MPINPDGQLDLTERQFKLVSTMLAGAIDWDKQRDKINGVDASYFTTEAERNLALLNNEYWHKRYPGREIYSINHTASACAVKRVIVCGGKTKFLLTPRAKQYTEVADNLERVGNHVWDALQFDRRTDQAFTDTFAHGKGGVVEVGWVYQDDAQEMRGDRPEDAVEAFATAALPIDAQPAMIGDMNGPMLEPQPMEFGSEQEAQDYANLPYDYELPKPMKDDPYIERFDPRDFLVDPQCTTHTLEDARFAFRRRYELLSEVKRNPRYKNKAGLTGTSYAYYKGRDLEGTEFVQPPDGAKDDLAVVELYDGYVKLDVDGDKRDELVHVILVQGRPKELLCELAPYPWFERCTVNPYPFRVCPGMTHDNSIYRSIPDVSACRDTQVAHDLAYTQVEWKRGHTPNLLLVPTGTFDGEDGEIRKRRIELGEENTVLELDPQAIISTKWLEPPLPNQEAYRTLQDAPQKIREIIGISEYQANAMPDKEVKVREVEYLSGQGGTRQDGEIERYHDFIADVQTCILILLQQFQERSRHYAFTSEDGNREWGVATPEQLRGIVPGSASAENMLGDLEEPGIQFMVSVDPSKKTPKNEITERKQALELLEVMQPYIQQPDPRLPNRPLVNLPPLLRGILETYDLSNRSEIIPPNPSPEEVQAFQQQQIEQAKKQAALQAAGALTPPEGGKPNASQGQQG